MRQDVVSVPGPVNVATADVALATRLAQYLRPLRSCEAIPTRSPIRILALLTETAQLNS
jgi:hypothetical protein